MSRGSSLVEVMVAALLFVLLLIPLARLLMSANRAGVAANRLLEVTAYGETVLEAVELLMPEELSAQQPGVPASGTFTVYESLGLPLTVASGGAPPAAPTGVVTVQKLRDYLDQPHFPFQLYKRLTVEALPGGHVSVELKLGFPRLPTDTDPGHSVLLRGTLTRRIP